jgi:carboxylesterase
VAALVVLILGLVAAFLALGYLIDYRFMFRRPEISDSQGRREFLKGCSPFELGRGDRAVLVIHGIAGSAAQMREMSEGLARSGFHVYGVTLPGHGTDHEDLYGIGWRRWYSHVEAELERVHERHGQVSVVGFSLGAALGLRLAFEHPGRIGRLVVMSAGLYHFHDYLPTSWMLGLAGAFASSARTFPKRLPDSESGPEYMIYGRIPLDALKAVVDLVEENRPRLGEVRTPSLIVHSRRDVACRPRSAEFIYEALGSAEKRLVWLENAPHGLMHGSEQDKAVLHNEVVSFLSS